MTTPWPSRRGETETDGMDMTCQWPAGAQSTLRPPPTLAISISGSFLCFLVPKLFLLTGPLSWRANF